MHLSGDCIAMQQSAAMITGAAAAVSRTTSYTHRQTRERSREDAAISYVTSSDAPIARHPSRADTCFSMDKKFAEVERIARAERLLGQSMGPVFAQIVLDIGAACDITIERMRVCVRPDGTTGPEPSLHFVITRAEMRAQGRPGKP
jgi:hypothetical protein